MKKLLLIRNKGFNEVRMMNYLKYITAGIRNKPGRNAAVAFCFAVIAVSIFSGQYLMAGTSGSIDQGISRMGADNVVVPLEYMVFLKGSGPLNTFAIIRAEPLVYRLNTGIMGKIRNVSGVSAMSPQLYVSTLSLPELSSSPVDVFGIDPLTDFTIHPWLRHPLNRPLNRGEVILGNNLSGVINSRISIKGHSYTVAGNLDPTKSAIDNTIFLVMDDAYSLAATEGVVPISAPRIVEGDVNAILIHVEKGNDPDKVLAALRRVLPSSSITAIGRHFALDPTSEDVQKIPWLLNILSVVVVLAAFPLIALIAAMAAHERQREIGLIRSMGAKRNDILSLVLAESLFLAITGGIAGVCVSIAAFTLMNIQGVLNSALQVSFRMPSITAIIFMAGIALGVVIAIGSLASLYPAYTSSRMNPYDAIRDNV
jgi:putative ABC transport system permease protein